MIYSKKRPTQPSSGEARAQLLLKQTFALENRFEFESAQKAYRELQAHFRGSPVGDIASGRLDQMDDLINEKEIYARIHRNGKRVLSEIGVDFSENSVLMEIFMGADAVDFENSDALFVPLKSDYIERCIDQVPKKMVADPGLNAFGTGATPPFLKRPDSDDLRPANRNEFEQVVRAAGENADIVKIFSLPVATDKSVSSFETAQLMDKGFDGLKMTATRDMSDSEAAFLKEKPHWLDGTSLVTSLGVMKTMVAPFIRSARIGNNLLLLDLSIARVSGPQSPEALLTQIHAQVLFMMVLAQTITPGISCVHGGIPDVVGPDGDLSYSSPSQPLLNAAMARVNLWVTGFPSAQSGGSTSIKEVNQEAVKESGNSRDTLRRYGVHIVRHAMGALGSLNFFSLDKFIDDCSAERSTQRQNRGSHLTHGVIPLYLPADDNALEGIREIGEKGNPKNADHTLKHVDAFMNWEEVIIATSKKRIHFPDLDENVSGFDPTIL